MSFLSPERLVWLLAALPIIGFYILKTRLRRRTVATLLFWDQVFDEKRQRSLWKNLRHWISLLLQLAFVGLLGLALLDPLWNAGEDAGQQMVLVLDNSASMQTVDSKTGTTRFAQAVEKASTVAGNLRPGDELALITAGTSVRVAVGMSDFAPTVQETLNSLSTSDGPTRIEPAVQAARRLASDDQRRRIVIFSDAGIQERQSIELQDDVRWVTVGNAVESDSQAPPKDNAEKGDADNVGITVFQVRRSTVDPIGYSLLVRLQNFGSVEATGRLKLTLADSRGESLAESPAESRGESLVDVIPFQIPPNEKWQKTVEATSQSGGIMTGSIDCEDALTVDNKAFAVLPKRATINVRLNVAESIESYYLQRVLESIPLVNIVTDSAIEDSSVLNIYAGVIPDSLPDGPALFVDVQDDGPSKEIESIEQTAWTIGESVAAPIIAKQNKTSPILRHVQLQNVVLAGGRDIQFNDRFGQPTTLLETAGGDQVLVSVERAKGRLLILAADLDGSDLPLRIAFPVMMTNGMNWFFRETGEMNPSLKTGQITTVPWDVSGPMGDDLNETVEARETVQDERAVLVGPEGKRLMVTVQDDEAAVGPLETVGIYGLFEPDLLAEYDKKQTEQGQANKSASPTTSHSAEELIKSVKGELIAVNLCDANESNLRAANLSPQQRSAPPPVSVMPWFLLAFVALGLVVTEWALFNRRVVA